MGRMIFFTFLFQLLFIRAEPIPKQITPQSLWNARRILRGHEVGETRPYMVYLTPAVQKDIHMASWLCGGAIIHEQFVLTSAACIEDVEHFYVISGTHRWTPATEPNDCVKNGAKKAVWKCVPQSYVFDGKSYDNVLWMADDIAVVKVESNFNFQRRIEGCDFVPNKVAYNDISPDLEKPGTTGSIAGWGTVDRYSGVKLGVRSDENSPELLEADVKLISKKNCKKRWDQRYHHIIDQHMICTKDSSDDNMCNDRDAKCKPLEYSDEAEEDATVRRMIMDPPEVWVHGAHHNSTNSSRRSNTKNAAGGFCENDHGGPLVVGHNKNAIVVGIISACLTQELTKKCYGPFLYTSVWRNRQLINCAIGKEIRSTCRRLLRSSRTHMTETVFDWSRVFGSTPEPVAEGIEVINMRMLNTTAAEE